MKALILCFLVLLATAQYPWPGVIVDNPGSGGSSDSVDSSDPTDEYSTSDDSDTIGICWKLTYGRGAAQQPTQGCPEGLILIGSFCYNPCEEGYSAGFFSGIEPEDQGDPSNDESTSEVESYCWENCPSDYTDYNGFANSCTSLSGTDSFNKDYYNRTYVGTLGCAPGLDLDDNDGLCYDEPPQEGYTCDGSFCSGPCPHGWDVCGALCTKPGLCANDVLNEGYAVSFTLYSDASDLTDNADGASVSPFNVPGVSQSPSYPWCH